MSIFTFPTLHPAKCAFCGDGFSLSEASLITISRVEDASLSILQKRFPSAAVQESAQSFTLTLTNGSTPPPFPAVPAKPDAYALTVSPDGISAAANTSAGLFYAAEALIHLPENVPGMTLTDWAAVPLRMLHWDLKGYLPRFDVLCDELRILAEYKINSILLELEDKYDFRCASGIAVEGAYTYEELRTLSKLAASLHIRIVPKLQSIAHVDYILKHPPYAHLRENNHVFQYCAMNPEVQTLWEKMAAELMDVFQEHAENGYFHIGADEPGNLGECPECRKLGAAGSYKHKVQACIDFVNAHGWKPIMWDDIVRNAGKTFTPEEEKALRLSLGKDAVMMYWAYGYGGHKNELPYLKEYLSEGLTVFGASGYAGCDNWAGSVPPMEYRALNIDAWTRAAVENNLNSVCATGWTRIGSADCPAEPQESCWFTVLYAALSMWTGLAFPYEDFCRDLLVDFYGTDTDEALVSTAMSIHKAPYDYDTALSATADGDTSRLAFLRMAAALESLAGKRERILNYFQYYDSKLGNAMEDYRLNLLNRITDELLNNLRLWKEKTRAVYSAYYMPVTVEEILRTRFGYLEKLAGAMRKLLDETVPM